MFTRKLLIGLASISALSLMIAAPASAVSITATETIEDGEPFELLNRDLVRTLSVDGVVQSVINDDGAIVTSNNVDGDFGVWNFDDVGYSHNLTWLNPAAANFISATLEIFAYGADGNNDEVFTETLDLGHLNSDGSLLEGFTTTIFSSSNPAQLSLLLADGFLNVVVDKNRNANILGKLDPLSVYKSTLSVTYNPVDVPEPATLLLLGSGLIAGARLRRKSA